MTPSQPSDTSALPVSALRWRCPHEELRFETTADVSPVERIVGQDTAIEALRFGLRTNAPGQHVFVRGLAGTGRLSSVQELLGDLRLDCPPAPDRAFVRNFMAPDRPSLLTLPREQAMDFHDRVAAVARFVERDLASAMDAQVVRSERTRLDRELIERIRNLTGPVDAALREKGLALVNVQQGNSVRPVIAPLIEGKPVPPDELEAMKDAGQIDEARVIEIEGHIRDFGERLEDLGRRLYALRSEHQSAVQALMEQHARGVMEEQVADLLRDYPDDDVGRFLRGVVADVVESLGAGGDDRTPPSALYAVNVVRGQAEGDACPAVIEGFPSLERLVGSIEVPSDAENAEAAHLWIRTGAMLEADGGYLVLEAKEVVSQPYAWNALMRTLRSRLLEVVPPESGRNGSAFLKPDPVPIHVKVVLVGDHNVHAALGQLDDDFAALFKVIADFDSTIPRTAQGIQYYCGVLSKLAREEKLPPFRRDAMAALVEHGARIAGQGHKLTSRFGRLADIAREAALVAGDAQRDAVQADDVTNAIQRTRRRADLSARKFRELVAKGIVLIQTRDRAIGQINGLAVIQSGPLTYGFPARITATVAPGTGGTINIEREADLSGAIHTKGFYILGGLLRRLLRADHPLTFDASIAFEQSYGGIDGDSASAAEICCLLSALTEIPLRQDLAMTGAIDQVGNILPIGSVTEKVEGFYDTCLDAGITGTQGVVVPRANVADLMLRAEVVDACGRGEFHVHAAGTIHEALALFTGMTAGARDATNGAYPEDSVLGRAAAAARLYWRLIQGDGNAPNGSAV